MSINRPGLRFLSCIFAMTVILCISGSLAEAQSKIPDGSYKESCKDMHVVGGFLTASCQNEKGQWVNSKINIDYCAGDIWNENGTLKCKQKPAPKPPSGSYQNSCRDIKVEGNKLRASCEKKNGNWKSTSINYKKCKRDIWNDNGELSCSKKNGVKIPKGTYKDTCRDAYTEGNRLYADCQKRNGGWNKSSINYKTAIRTYQTITVSSSAVSQIAESSLREAIRIAAGIYIKKEMC